MGEFVSQLRQFVSGNRAGRRVTDSANRVSAAGGAGRENATFEKRLQIFSRGNVTRFFSIFQCPLLFGGVNLAQVVDTRILH